MEINIFKLEYDWYEGEHKEILIGKDTSQEQFEKDLNEAKNFAISLIGKEIKNHDYLGKGYSVECLPEYYEQIVWFLINKKGYAECFYDKDISYSVDDSPDKKISVNKYENKVNQTEL